MIKAVERIHIFEAWNEAVSEHRIACRNIVSDSREQLVNYLRKNGYRPSDKEERGWHKEEISGTTRKVYSVDTWGA